MTDRPRKNPFAGYPDLDTDRYRAALVDRVVPLLSEPPPPGGWTRERAYLVAEIIVRDLEGLILARVAGVLMDLQRIPEAE